MTEDQLHTRVGTAALVGLGVAVALVLGMEGRHIRPGIRVHVELERIGALTEGGPVRVAGTDIGSVDHIRLLPLAHAASYKEDPTAERARVVLDVWIDARYRGRVRERSEFFQNQPSVLGEAYLEVGPPRDGGDAGAPIADGATVRGADPPRMDRIMQKSYENLKTAMDLIKNGLPEAHALGVELDGLSAQLDDLAAPGDVDRLLEGRKKLWAEGALAYAAWEKSGTTVDGARGTAARARAALARARLEIQTVREKLDHVLANLDTLRAHMDPEAFDRLEAVTARTDALFRQAEDLLANAEAIAAMVDRGEGTIGAFLHDTELADEFKAMSKVIKQTPWETIGHPQSKRPDP
jgi:phospholipid/cholesterol/gamma-HCH transport system substrate-binding protein